MRHIRPSTPPPIAPDVPRRRTHSTPSRPPPERILFYHSHQRHFSFTNFSPHPILYCGKRYSTGEHLFQSLKFVDIPDLMEHIRTYSEEPREALAQARRFKTHARKDWRQVNISIMDEVLRCKFSQHPNLARELIDTGTAELVENSHVDSYWGIGADGKGQNELGKALMRLRDLLR